MTQSQQFVPIEDIQEDLIMLKEGGVSLVLTVSAVNFGLLFETEQISIIDSFAGLLNSLSFPIQIVIHSQRLDVSSYLHTIDKAYLIQTNPLLKNMTSGYRRFAASIIKDNNVLDKKFYVVIMVTGAELGLMPSVTKEKIRRAATILMPRRDHMIRQLSRLGLKTRQMTTAELVKLFFEIYNPPDFELLNVNLTAAPPSLQPKAPVLDTPKTYRPLRQNLTQSARPVPPPPSLQPTPTLNTTPQPQAMTNPTPPLPAQLASRSEPVLQMSPPPLPPAPILSQANLASPYIVEELPDDA